MIVLSTRSATALKSHQDRNISTGENTWEDEEERKGGRQIERELGSVLPLRYAAFHLQHLRPAFKFVGFCAVLYMLRRQTRDTQDQKMVGGVTLNEMTADAVELLLGILLQEVRERASASMPLPLQGVANFHASEKTTPIEPTASRYNTVCRNKSFSASVDGPGSTDGQTLASAT